MPKKKVLTIEERLRPALGSLKLKAITSAHVQVLYRSKLKSGLSGRTVKFIHTVLNKSLKYAVRHSLIPRNSCEAVTPPRVMKKEIKALSPRGEEITRGSQRREV